MRFPLFALLLACAAAHAGVPESIFEHGDIDVQADGLVTVRSGLVQIELAQGIVLSAPRGAQFSLAPRGTADRARELTVHAGAVRVLKLDTQQLTELAPGNYRIGAARSLAVAVDPLNSSRLGDGRPDLRLTDMVLVRQNTALQIPTEVFLRSFFQPFVRH